MPGGLPLGLETVHWQSFPNATISNGGTVLTGATQNTFSGATWVTIGTPTSDTSEMEVSLVSPTGSSARSAVNIGVGATPNIVVNALICAGNTNLNSSYRYKFPVQVAGGTAIKAQASSNAGTDAPSVIIRVADAAYTNMEGAAGVDALGYVGGSTGGTTVTAGTTPSYNGTYTQLVASTSVDYMGLMIGVLNASVADLAILKIAIGAAASEKDIVPDLMVVTQTGNGADNPSTFGPYMIQIPAGTRISANLAMRSTTGGTLDVVAYGIYQ
jgi:hypothetical protein